MSCVSSKLTDLILSELRLINICTTCYKRTLCNIILLCFFSVQEDADFIQAATEMKVMHPKILVKGNIRDINEKAVVAEKTMICSIQGLLIDAVVVYMAVNYVFMFEYPIGFNHFCLFLQKCVFHIHDGKKLPASVLDLINKLDSLAVLN